MIVMVASLETDGAVVAVMVVPAHVTLAMPFVAMAKSISAVVVMVPRTTAVILGRGGQRGPHERGIDQPCKTHLHWVHLTTCVMPCLDALALNGR